MTDLINLAKNQSLKLAPFLNTLVLYFAFVRQDPQGELWTTVLKCLPIVALMLYVMFKGYALTRAYKRSHCILLGLIFSCGGDALLNVNLFPFGMLSFGVAHAFYISAFGWQPRKWLIGIGLYLPVVIFCFLVYGKLDTVLLVGVPIYSVLISTMLWRALARASDKCDFLSVFCAVGAVLFVISDALIAVTMFMKFDIPNKRLLIMVTYYAAQFAIAISTADDGPCRDNMPQKAKKLK